jgi:hypothetical protein
MFRHSLKSVVNLVAKFKLNLGGWRSAKKFLIIESDDWGSIRMPSLYVYESLLNNGIRVDRCHYNRYDSLATSEDLDALFTVLTAHRDHLGNHPVLTANAVMANPDFDKIRESGFRDYHFEPFTFTLSKYAGCNNSFMLWQEGMRNGFFHPQFHGREHLNVNRWMNALRQGSIETLLAFQYGVFGISTTITNEKRKSYLAAFDFDNVDEINFHKNILKQGIDLFESLIAYKPLSFIAPNYIWHHELEPVLAENGVKFIQGGSFQHEPTGKEYRHFTHSLGSHNENRLTYLNRNCTFEPSSDTSKNWVGSALRDISVAFLLGKPAVITSHRVNFIGAIDASNRKENLESLNNLLKQVLLKWPDVEFVSSDQLGAYIESYS